MSETNKKQQSGIKDLIAKGREQGYLTYAEVNDHLPEDMPIRNRSKISFR